MGVRHAEMKQLDPMRTVIKNQFPREKHRGRFETTGLNIGAGFCGFLPAARRIRIVSGFVALHLLDDAGVRYRGRAILDPNLIAVGVVAVMMRIEGKTYRLCGQGADFRQDVLGARREIGIDD